MDACQISPANLDAVITVGASEVDNKFNLGQQQHDILYTYSNSGSCVDLFAPGTLAWSDKAHWPMRMLEITSHIF